MYIIMDNLKVGYIANWYGITDGYALFCKAYNYIDTKSV